MSFFSIIAEHSEGSLTGPGIPQTAAALLSPTPIMDGDLVESAPWSLSIGLLLPC